MAKPPRPAKRSVSPFGFVPPPPDPLEAIKRSYRAAFGEPPAAPPAVLKTSDDAAAVPSLVERWERDPGSGSAANLFDFLVKQKRVLEEKGVAEGTYDALARIFKDRIAVFLVDHFDREACEKRGWPDAHRDVVLFGRERDVFVARYLAPWNESAPGRLSEFVTSWSNDPSPDRALHLVDFCAGAKNPTFDHYLLFSNPAFGRIVEQKRTMAALLERGRPVLARLGSPTWERDTRKTFGLD